MADFITGGLGLGMQAWGLINAMQNQKWQRGQEVDQMNRQQEAISYGRDRWQQSADPARDAALNLLQLFGGDVQNSRFRLNDLAERFPGLIESLSGRDSDPFGRGMNPAMSSLLDRIYGTGDAYGDASSAAFGDYTGGGDPRSNDLMDRIFDVVNGRGQQMGGLSEIGDWLQGTRGRNDFINNASERGIDVMNRGGMTPILQDAYDRLSEITKAQGKTAALDRLSGKGLDLFGREGSSDKNESLFSAALKQLSGGALGTAGLTEAGGKAEQAGLDDIVSGGKTPEADYLLERGRQLSAENPLLSMDQVLQIAREDASRTGLNAFRKATRDAVMRGGKAASIVQGTGETGEYADLLAREVADAERKAMMEQQGLRLQQTNTGAGMVGNAGNLTNTRYGAAADLVKGMEGNATSRFAAGANLAGTAMQDALGRMNIGSNVGLNAQEQETKRFLESLGLMPRVSDSAGNQANIFGNLGLGSEAQANTNLRTGLDAYNMYNNTRLGGINAATGQLDQSARAKLNSGNLLNTFLTGGVNANNAGFNNNLNAGGFGAQLNTTNLTALQQLFNNFQSMNNNNYAGYQGGIGNLMDLARLGQAYSAAGLPQGGGIGQSNTSQVPGMISALGAGLGNVKFPSFGGGGNSTGAGVSGTVPNGPAWNTIG